MIECSKLPRIPRPVRRNAWVVALLTIGISCDACAAITTDSSLGQPAQALAGPNYTIPETVGKLSGSNLFHSFNTFNILTGESANFTTATSGIANVISRVTGGSLSQINGLLKLTPASGAPAFFFINPAGVTFGAGASIDVPGAFHVSTADYIKFPDGNLHADLNQASTFSISPPEAFGFLGTARATITVNGATTLAASQQPMSIVAGDIEINDGIVGTLNGGDIRVVALGQWAQEIGFTGALPAVDGNLSILNSGLNSGQIISKSTSSDNVGSIKVSAGSITIDGQGSGSVTGISSVALNGTGNAGYVDVKAAGSLSIVNGGSISSSTSSSGNAGHVTVGAGTLLVDGAGSSINALADNLSSGQAGDVTVKATDSITLSNGGQLSIQNDATVADPSIMTWNSLVATAPTITINGGKITASTTGNGNAGQLNIGFQDVFEGANYVRQVVTRNLFITNGGQISSDTSSSGNAGSVRVNAGSITLDNQGSGSVAGIFSDAMDGTGNAGSVEITVAGSLSVFNGGVISSSTWTSGNAGSVLVNAESVTIDGQGDFTGIFSGTYNGTGNAGSVEITATGSLSIVGGVIDSSTLTSGNAGSVLVNAESVTIDGQVNFTGIFNSAGIHSGTYTYTGTGNAGSIDVTATGSLSIANGGEISSSTYSHGIAGSVMVSAGTLLVDGIVDGSSSRISASAADGSSGQTGSVIVAANDITLSNGGQISIKNNASVADPLALAPTSISVTAPRITILNSPNAVTTSSTGNIAAGSIDIRASDNLYIDPSGITTTSNLGNGGAINIQAGMLSLINSQIATSVAGLTGNGGNITIASSTLILNTGFIMANTAAANAIGGTVSIAAQNLIPSGNTLFIGGSTPYTYQPGVFGFNVIQAAAPTGVSGTVQTTSPALDVSGSLSGLNTQVIDTGGLSRSPCQATGGSSMAQSGRGGLPPSARGMLRAELNLSPINSNNHASAGADNMHVALPNWGCS